MLVIPACCYALTGEWYQYVTAAYVFNVTEGGIELWGVVFHDSTENGTSVHSISRSLYIDDCLYTVSETVVKVNSLIDLSEMGALVYSDSYPWYWLSARDAGGSL